jgi:hypothetical protein
VAGELFVELGFELCEGRASSLFEASISRSWTKARTTWTVISTARGLLKIVAAMMAPCSVKA